MTVINSQSSTCPRHWPLQHQSFLSQQKELITSSAGAIAEMALCPLQHHSHAAAAAAEMMQQKATMLPRDTDHLTQLARCVQSDLTEGQVLY